MGFPGATADRDAAAYVVIGAPLDVTASFRPGARFGPDRVRQFAAAFEDYDHRTDRHFSDLGVHDFGDLHAWTDVEEYLDHLAREFADIVRDGAVPLLLGGEHTVMAAGVRAVDPDVVVVCDAHLDLRESFDGDPWSHATATHHALSVADEAVILGARAGSEAEWRRAEAENVTVVPPAAVSTWDPPTDGRSVYLSVDVDAADPSVAPGTGTMEPFGLGSRTLRDAVRRVAPLADGFDVVEVTDDDAGQTAALAGKLLREFVFAHAEARS